MPDNQQQPFRMGPRAPVPPRRPEELDGELIDQCRAFLAVQVPESNILFVDEFNKYMPLFNKVQQSQTNETVLKDLSDEYFGRFSTQHPIQILSREPDPQGVFYRKHKGRFKLEKTIPPLFRRAGALNELGAKVPALINAFFNATINPSSPYDTRKAEYAQSIAQALIMTDQKNGSRASDEQRFKQMSDALINGEAQPSQDQASSPSGSDDSPLSGVLSWD